MAIWKKFDETLTRINSLKNNQLKIYDYFKLNCSDLFVQYPDLEIFNEVEICYNYQTSLILGKVTLFLSTLYDTYLPYALYGPPIIPVVVMGFTSVFLLFINFTSNAFIIQILESTLIVAGFVMIHHLQWAFPNFDVYLNRQCSKLKR